MDIDIDNECSSQHSPGSLDNFLLDLRRHLAVSRPPPQSLVQCAAKYLLDLQGAISITEDSNPPLSAIKYNQNHDHQTINPGLINTRDDQIEESYDYEYDSSTVIHVSSSADDNDCNRVARDTTHAKGMIISSDVHLHFNYVSAVL